MTSYDIFFLPILPLHTGGPPPLLHQPPMPSSPPLNTVYRGDGFIIEFHLDCYPGNGYHNKLRTDRQGLGLPQGLRVSISLKFCPLALGATGSSC